MEIIDNRFRIIKKIYNSEIADTYLTEDIENNNTIVDIKILVSTKHINNILFNMFKSEIMVIRNLNHKGLPKYITSNEIEDNNYKYFYIAYRHIEGKSLKQQLIDDPSVINKEFNNIAIQLLEILKYLEKKSIIHKSISFNNILIDADFKIHLINFGSIRNKLDSGRVIEPIIGNVNNMPNEQRLGFTTLKSDQYSLGIVLVELLGIDMIKDDIKSKSIIDSILFSLNISDNLKKFLYIMINNDSTERFTSIEYAYNIFKKIINNEEVEILNGYNKKKNIEDEYIAEQIVKNEMFYAEMNNNKYKKLNNSTRYKIFIYFFIILLWGYLIYYFLGTFMKMVEKPNSYQKMQYGSYHKLDKYHRANKNHIKYIKYKNK